MLHLTCSHAAAYVSAAVAAVVTAVPFVVQKSCTEYFVLVQLVQYMEPVLL